MAEEDEGGAGAPRSMPFLSWLFRDEQARRDFCRGPAAQLYGWRGLRGPGPDAQCPKLLERCAGVDMT